MIETEELVCKKLHMPYPNVRIPANTRVSIGPPWLVEALCARGFFERVAPDILLKEHEQAEARLKDAVAEANTKESAEVVKPTEKKEKRGK